MKESVSSAADFYGCTKGGESVGVGACSVEKTCWIKYWQQTSSVVRENCIDIRCFIQLMSSGVENSELLTEEAA